LIRLILVLIGTVALDQITKYAVHQSMKLHESIPVFGEVVQLTYIRNPGAAFGINVSSPSLFLALSLLACGVMVYYFTRLPASDSRGRFALTLILGGAVGNLIDRIRLSEVIDFINVGVGEYRWPVFNVADSAVTIGVIFLFIRLSFFRSETSGEPDPERRREYTH
jgi:signal peptidase II